MSLWNVKLLGTPEAERDGVRVHLRSRLTWCVLASLLIARDGPGGGWVSRATLLERFWPDHDSGRVPLRMALTSLRQGFGPDVLESEADRVRLRGDLFRTD